jgi:hypothetical protein
VSALLLLLLAAPSSAAKIRYTPACDMKHHAKRAKELVELEAADQKDREGEIKAVDWNRIRPRDLKRRERAAAIFAEGCVKTAADYFNIAMIYQHGDASSSPATRTRNGCRKPRSTAT